MVYGRAKLISFEPPWSASTVSGNAPRTSPTECAVPPGA